MTENHSRSRKEAEIAFAEAQSQFLVKDRRAVDIDPVKQAREEKTLRLREARLSKESEEKAALAALSPAKKQVTDNGPQKCETLRMTTSPVAEMLLPTPRPLS